VIVVDTNVLAYFFIDGAQTPLARSVMMRDPDWAAPTLWRSEFCNVLMLYLRKGTFTYSHAANLVVAAEATLAAPDWKVDPAQILSLALASGCTSYDCEFVAAAQSASVPLVTADRKVLNAFPTTAVSLQDFIA
jgi:predicted nucleic acid-binding protein